MGEKEYPTTGASRMNEGPRIYNLFPLLAGPMEDWSALLRSIADMGFNWIFVNPFHLPGSSGSLYAVADYEQLHPLVQGDSTAPPDELFANFLKSAERYNLAVMMDLVINHTASDAPLVHAHPDWYRRNEAGEICTPFAADPDDPAQVTHWHDLAELDYSERPERQAMMVFWDALVTRFAALGVRGFRCDAAYKLPGSVWRELIDSARRVDPRIEFFAETLGAQLSEVEQLAPAGFNYFFNSAKWWDFESDWLLDQYEQFRHLAPSIAFPESHDTRRLAAEGDGSARESRFWFLFTAVFATGVMMPMGYEYGFRRALHVVNTTPQDWEKAAFDLSSFIAAVNQMKARTPVLNMEGPQHHFTRPEEPVLGLLRCSDLQQGHERNGREADRVVVLINADHQKSQCFALDRLAEVLDCESAGIVDITPAGNLQPGDDEQAVLLPPRSIRLFEPGSCQRACSRTTSRAALSRRRPIKRG